MSCERGFTLLELLIAIVLIGLLASLGAQTVFDSRADLDRLTDRIERALYKARWQARESGRPVSIACKRLTGSRDGLPAAEASGTSCRRDHHPADPLTFYPDGSSSGVTLELRAGDDRVRLSVDWLSGEIVRD